MPNLWKSSYICVPISYVPVKLKLKHPSPGIWVCIVPGKGGFERCLGRVGNLNRIYLSFWRTTPVSVASLTEDRISLLLVNNSFKRVFKRSLKVPSRHISLWKVWTAFDWRRNLSLRRGISELIGGAFERLFCPEWREFEQANLQKFKCPGGCPGGCPGVDVEASIWLVHYLKCT